MYIYIYIYIYICVCIYVPTIAAPANMIMAAWQVLHI